MGEGRRTLAWPDMAGLILAYRNRQWEIDLEILLCMRLHKVTGLIWSTLGETNENHCTFVIIRMSMSMPDFRHFAEFHYSCSLIKRVRWRSSLLDHCRLNPRRTSQKYQMENLTIWSQNQSYSYVDWQRHARSMLNDCCCLLWWKGCVVELQKETEVLN